MLDHKKITVFQIIFFKKKKSTSDTIGQPQQRYKNEWKLLVIDIPFVCGLLELNQRTVMKEDSENSTVENAPRIKLLYSFALRTRIFYSFLFIAFNLDRSILLNGFVCQFFPPLFFLSSHFFFPLPTFHIWIDGFWRLL